MVVRFDERGGSLRSAPVCANRSRRRPLVGPIALSFFWLSLALTITACSSYSTSDHSAALQNRATEESSAAHRGPVHPQNGSHETHRALVAPNCELAEPEPDTVDSDLWTRLKLDYERHCYKQAEILARKRLRQLLTAGRCGYSVLFRSSPFRHNYANLR